jgi:hypothetical protein
MSQIAGHPPVSCGQWILLWRACAKYLDILLQDFYLQMNRCRLVHQVTEFVIH